jgi:hypothetical protein
MGNIHESPLFWTLVAASVPVAAATLYWATKKTYDTYVPYQVRPPVGDSRADAMRRARAPRPAGRS